MARTGQDRTGANTDRKTLRSAEAASWRQLGDPPHTSPATPRSISPWSLLTRAGGCGLKEALWTEGAGRPRADPGRMAAGKASCSSLAAPAGPFPLTIPDSHRARYGPHGLRTEGWGSGHVWTCFCRVLPAILAPSCLSCNTGEQHLVPSRRLRFPLSWGVGRGAKLCPENPLAPQPSRSPWK